MGAGARVLLTCPGLNGGRAGVFQPAVRIVNCHAMIDIGDVNRRRGHVLRQYRRGGQHRASKQDNSSPRNHGHSAGAAIRARSLSVLLTSAAIMAVATTKPSAITAVAASNRSE